MTAAKKQKHEHEWGYVTTEKVEVYKPSPVGAFCIICKKLRHPVHRRKAG